MPHRQRIIFYDQHCKLCGAAINFVRRHDRNMAFRYVPLNTPEALARLPHRTAAIDTIFLIDQTGIHDRSTAALRIAAQLDRPWPLLRHLRWVPRFIRDAAYNFIARNRYRWA